MKTENVIQELENVLNNGNSNNLFNTKFYDLVYKLPVEEREDVFQHFLLNKKHYEHEEIAGEFQRTYNQDTNNIEILLRAIENVPEYLSTPDLKYSYIRKCIYAIGAQPCPQNLDALIFLTKNKDPEISNFAELQLNKRKELGRWEHKKTMNK